MIKKIDILGLQLDNYTVREAIMRVETYLGNNVLNTIESISMRMLMESEQDEILKEVISSLDLAVIGEKEILQATKLNTMQRIRETEENDFFYEFFKRVERNRKSVFVLGETTERVEWLKERLQQDFSKLNLVGSYATETCVGDLDAVINELNATTPDVIVSVIPSPQQEHFFFEHRDKMNANIWYGIGDLAVKQKRSIWGKLMSIVHRGKLKNSIQKYDTKNEDRNEK